MNTKTVQGHFRLRCLDSRIPEPFDIDKKKVLIGTIEHADIRLLDKSVSSTHCFVCQNGIDGLMVKDLYSENGVYINGKRVEECFAGPGDILTIGTLSFTIEALEGLEDVPDFNPDELITPVLPATSAVEIPAKTGLVFIDGEYCDIQFDESKYKPLTKIPLANFKGKYIELEETVEPLDIAHNVKTKKLEVVSYMNGMTMDVTYLELKDGDYSLSPIKKSKYDILFHSVVKTKIFTIKKGELRFYPQEVISPSMPWDQVSFDEPLFLTQGAEQISIRFVDNATKWKGIPIFYREREFYVTASKWFFGLFLPLLVLLLIPLHEPDEVKETVAVVYKIPEKRIPDPPKKPMEDVKVKQEVKTEVVQTPKENTGHKETQQTPTKVEHSAASAKKKVVAKAQAPKARPTPVAAPKAAASKAAPPAPKAAPVKTYEFKTSSAVAMNALVGDAPKINTTGSASKASVKDAAFNAGSSDSGPLVSGANIGVSKFNGSDKRGSGSSSYGSKGLASKKGFDSSYLEPKTVVLGSMDPELLRRILREYLPQFRHCYQQELIGHSESIKGIIDLNFTISATGRVAKHNIRAKDARFSKKGINCMAQVLSLIDFPKPKGGGVVDVRQPLNFFAETEKI